MMRCRLKYKRDITETWEKKTVVSMQEEERPMEERVQIRS